MSFPAKMEFRPISGLSANARKLLDQPRAMKRRKLNGAVPKVRPAGEGRGEFARQISVQSN